MHPMKEARTISTPFFCEKCLESVWVDLNAPRERPFKVKCSKGHVVEIIE